MSVPGSVLTIVLGLGCAPDPVGPPDGPAVLLVTLDTTRADRIGAYGYALADTQTLDGLAAEGTRFARAYASTPLTIPSHATLFTGQPPPSHGVRDNGDFVLGPEAVTLAERFSAAGWETAAFTAAFPTRRRWGLDQGFDTYHDPLERLPTRLDWRDERTANEVIDDALAWLEQRSDPSLPAFVWVHLFDPHWPYQPPEPYATQYAGRPYDGEIAYADAQLGRLVEAWDAAFDRSVVAVTADHGEGLGDGGELTHGFLLHDGTMRVPLILRGEGVTAGLVIEDPVGHVDVAPTLLTIAGLAPDPSMPGSDLRAGGSEQLYAEALTGQYSLGLHPLRSYTDAEGRYIEGVWGGWYPVHDDLRVGTIPDRRSYDRTPRSIALDEMVAAMEPGIAMEASLDSRELARLMALGYVGGDPLAEEGDIDPRDVIDVIPLTWQARQLIGVGMFHQAAALLHRLGERMPGAYGLDLLNAQLLRARGRYEASIEQFTTLFVRSPSGTVALQLGDLELAMGRPGEAEDWYREALSRQPGSAQAMAGLVRSVQARGDHALAWELAAEFLVIYPDLAEVDLMRAELALADGHLDEALVTAESALDRLPLDPWAHAVTGAVLWELGSPDPAIDRLTDALRIDPYNVVLRSTKARWLLEVGRNAEAVRAIAPVARQTPPGSAANVLYVEAVEALKAELEESGYGGPKSTGLLRAYDPVAAQAFAKANAAAKEAAAEEP